MSMKITAHIPLGSSQITIEGDKISSLFMTSGFFAEIPQKCGACNGTRLALNGQKRSGFDFYSILCLDCRHELKFGQKKEDNSLFLRSDTAWEPPYQGGGGQQPQQPQQQQQQPPQGGGVDDSIPFGPAVDLVG